ncbi:MAG: DUF1868 domain-containing protein [Terrestrivirus sp.]|uniref:DUF1868 domain-containing protein n=1 Tax=Terrestrivirus sp. TaxID=2487775 RepID=A0A3G4ZP90_9VIRU|nr:MAG: DUF1868 domain-containing protein [Terrestrivirus sp.]
MTDCVIPIPSKVSMVVRNYNSFEDIYVLLSDLLSIFISKTECIINGFKMQINREQWNTFWITFDQVTGFFAIGLKKEPGHKYITCQQIKQSGINVREVKTNAQINIIDYVSLNQSPFKFDNFCNVISCYGTTIICKIPHDTALHEIIRNVQNIVKESAIGHYFGYTDPTSFHMTVFDLKRCDKEELDEKITKNMNDLNNILDTLKKQKFIMKLSGIEENAFHFGLVPNDEKILKWRNIISESTGIKNNPAYTFHITITYEIYKIIDPELVKMKKIVYDKMNKLFSEWIDREIIMENPMVCKFDNMNNFVELV